MDVGKLARHLITLRPMADYVTTIEPFVPLDLGPKPWGIELLVAKTETYIGKVLWMHAGHKGGLQYHEHKDETFYLFSGRAIVRFQQPDKTLAQTIMTDGMSFHIPPGAVHQVEALEDCIFFEASTPHFNDRVNVGAELGRPDTGQSR